MVWYFHYYLLCCFPWINTLSFSFAWFSVFVLVYPQILDKGVNSLWLQSNKSSKLFLGYIPFQNPPFNLPQSRLPHGCSPIAPFPSACRFLVPLSALNPKPSSLLFYHFFVWYYPLSSKPLVYWLPNKKVGGDHLVWSLHFHRCFNLSLHLISSSSENTTLVCKWLSFSTLEALLWCLLVSNFAVKISCAVLCYVAQIWGISFSVSRLLKFYDYELRYHPFFTYYARYLKRPHMWNPMSFFFWFPPHLFLHSFFVKLLWSKDKLSKQVIWIFHLTFSTVICLFKKSDCWEFFSTLSSNHSTTLKIFQWS